MRLGLHYLYTTISCGIMEDNAQDFPWHFLHISYRNGLQREAKNRTCLKLAISGYHNVNHFFRQIKCAHKPIYTFFLDFFYRGNLL